MSASISLSELKRLSNSLVGDQLAKVQMLISNDSFLLDELTDFQQGSSFQNLKLDILFCALNLEEDIRDELGKQYIDAVNKIYNIVTLPNSIDTNDSVTNFKYMRLINLCVEYCPPCIYPHASSLEAGLVHLVKKSLIPSEESNNIDDTRTIIELLKFVLHSKDKTMLKPPLLPSLESLLLSIADKYATNLNFNYVIRIKTTKSPSVPVKYDPFSNKGLELNTSIPNAININNPLDRALLSLGLALYPNTFSTFSFTYKEVPSLWKNIHFSTFAASLLKSGDINLRSAALTFLAYPYLEDTQMWEQKQKLKQILPYLVDCLNFQPLPWWFDPFETLNSLIELYHRHEPLNNPVITFLSKTNVMYGLLTLLSQCLSLKQQNKSSLNSITKFVKLCASFAAFDELYRSLLLEQKFLLHHLEFGMETHLRLLKEFLSHKQVIMDLEGHNSLPLPPLYDNEITMSWLLLLKSFSRSVTALRTSLKRNRLAELLLDLLRTTYKVTQECEFAGKELLRAEVDIMGITLGCICNFVVEFSNLQSFMLKSGIVRITGEILMDPLFNSKQPWTDETLCETLNGINTDAVKTNALWVLRHLMYNCQNSEKLDLLSKIPMCTILEYINDPSWSVQEQCFQLIRNLTCNSRKVVNILLENFKNTEYKNNPRNGARIAIGSTYLFEYLARKMKLLDPCDVIQKKTLEGILYIIVNLAAVNENKKELVIEQDEILNILHDILSESPQNVARYGNDSKLKLASLWVLNNLLWNSTISRYTHYALEGYTPSNEEEDNGQRNATPSNPSFTNETGINEDDENDNEDENDEEDDEDDDNDDDEFIHGAGSAAESSTLNANRAAIERCKKLVNMGMYDLVKQNIFDESLSVREKARTLLYHMDLLLKGSV